MLKKEKFKAVLQAKADGSYSRLLKTIAGLNLLMIDDWGLELLSAATRNDLMEIMDDRYEYLPSYENKA